MSLLFLKFSVLAAVIVVAGIYLATYADVLAEKLGFGRTLAGLVLLAAATSLPELAVDCSAVLMEKPAPDLAVGALIGSSLFNLLILAVLDLLHRRPDRIFSPVSQQHIISAVTSVMSTGLVVFFLVLNALKMSISWHWVGLGPAIIFAFYILSLRLVYLDQQHRREQVVDEDEPSGMHLVHATIGYIVATAAIFLSASTLAPVADQIALETGLGGTFIGSTLIALTTSLPELVTTAAAVRMGAFDMAMGNVVGSNNFNMAILFPVDVVYRRGVLLKDVELNHVFTGIVVILVTSVGLLAMVYQPKKKFWFIEPDSSLIVVLSVAAIYVLYKLGAGVP